MAAALLDRTFAALADPTRRAIVQRLASGDATVTQLAQPFAISLPAISRHLRVLGGGALISRGGEAHSPRCRFDPPALQPLGEWLDSHRHFWSESFDRLDAHLKAPAKTRGT